MITRKQIGQLAASGILAFSLSGCAMVDWLVYKIDIPQGNYMEKQQVEQLRIEMTKEQVEYVLGRPVLRDSFAENTWYYVYHFKSGRNAKITKKELIVRFEDDKVVAVDGDYELSENFNTPLGTGELPTVTSTVVEDEEQDPDELRKELEQSQE
ncbi:outer membrane protein assembly factor BamE [Paraferrimonas sedimenticola]|uniref:Outer membrane protein assembly factor BamE n=1 Tax=Paraferrimonas sedimenticola TaxID=375674 RepID=A0AA37RXQ0_9GAMM|nr:outer membrane protein assembly factor BamE [Paraferrimonas sedimenticola]GLP97111.1 outer membrane protein assembly factor BamE [Paraferrimonas sedimenticola]